MALTHRTFSHGIGVLTLSTLLASPPLMAEDSRQPDKPGKGSLALESLVVTGEKLDRELKDTASSVSIITDRDIDQNKTGDASVSEVINGSPNVIYTDSVGAPIIRGQDTQGPNNGQNHVLHRCPWRPRRARHRPGPGDLPGHGRRPWRAYQCRRGHWRQGDMHHLAPAVADPAGA